MKTVADTAMLTTPEYRQFIEDLKARVTTARISAARAVNRDLILLYWDIGRAIVEKQQTLGWGESVVKMVSADLQRAFPGTTGFSPRNLWDMKRFYIAYAEKEIWPQAVAKLEKGNTGRPTEILRQPVAELGKGQNRLQPVAKLTEANTIEFLQQLVAEIPWGHNLLILNRLTDPAVHPSIGIILCAEKDDVEVEYALATKRNPIGVAVYKLQSKLPSELKGKLPTARQLSDAVRAFLPESGGKKPCANS